MVKMLKIIACCMLLPISLMSCSNSGSSGGSVPLVASPLSSANIPSDAKNLFTIESVGTKSLKIEASNDIKAATSQVNELNEKVLYATTKDNSIKEIFFTRENGNKARLHISLLQPINSDGFFSAQVGSSQEVITLTTDEQGNSVYQLGMEAYENKFIIIDSVSGKIYDLNSSISQIFTTSGMEGFWHAEKVGKWINLIARVRVQEAGHGSRQANVFFALDYDAKKIYQKSDPKHDDLSNSKEMFLSFSNGDLLFIADSDINQDAVYPADVDSIPYTPSAENHKNMLSAAQVWFKKSSDFVFSNANDYFFFAKDTDGAPYIMVKGLTDSLNLELRRVYIENKVVKTELASSVPMLGSKLETYVWNYPEYESTITRNPANRFLPVQMAFDEKAFYKIDMTTKQITSTPWNFDSSLYVDGFIQNQYMKTVGLFTSHGVVWANKNRDTVYYQAFEENASTVILFEANTTGKLNMSGDTLYYTERVSSSEFATYSYNLKTKEKIKISSSQLSFGNIIELRFN